MWLRPLGSLVDFERAFARGDDPITDDGDMFAGIASVDLRSFGNIESKFSAARGSSFSTWMLG